MSRRATILIDPEQWHALLSEALGRFPLETGGILMGNWSSDCLAIISDVIGPGPAATHQRSTFDPDQEWQEIQVERIWSQRGRLVEYLGDWHTHPRGGPRPSKEDLATAHLIASAPEARAERPIMLVLGISCDGTVKPNATVFSGRRLKRTQLRIDSTFDDAELDGRHGRHGG